MITLGVDAHKEVHVAVAVDELGRPLDAWQGPNSEAAWRRVAGLEQPVGMPPVGD